MKRYFWKVPCKYCGKLIGSNMLQVHHRTCSAAIQAKEAQRLERIKTAPIETLTYGEIREADRLEEMRRKLAEQ